MVIYNKTPLQYSSLLSERAGCHIYLKLENTQPSGSFKNRGVGHLAESSYSVHKENTHFICSSGGNAGLAAAYSASVLKAKCTVFVPTIIKPTVIHRMRNLGVTVIQGGKDWFAADAEARKLVDSTEGGVYLPPFDHPLVVEGNSSIVKEISDQLVEQGEIRTMDAISLSVGGGGLLAGVLHGLKKQGDVADDLVEKIKPVSVIACETYGAASLSLSLRSSYSSSTYPLSSLPTSKLERLNGIKTIATSLGATAVSMDCLSLALGHNYGLEGVESGVSSVVMSDKITLDNIRLFANAEMLLLEPGCSASITPILSPQTLQACLPSTSFPPRLTSIPIERFDSNYPIIIIIVCGGNTMSLSDFEGWEKEFEGVERGKVEVFNGGLSSEIVSIEV